MDSKLAMLGPKAGQMEQAESDWDKLLALVATPALDAIPKPASASDDSEHLRQLAVSLQDVDTPTLLLDLDAFEHNVRAMAAHCKTLGCLWRPHLKAIRNAQLAKIMLDEGACGVTCAKVSQAAAMVDGGVMDILVANQVIGARKISSLVALALRGATLCVACDDEGNLRDLSAAAQSAGVELSVLVDLNVGMHRCGLPHNAPATIIELCRLATLLPAIAFRGLMGYDGHTQTATMEAREEVVAVARRLHAAREAVEAAGLAVPLVSGAGSGNFIQVRIAPPCISMSPLCAPPSPQPIWLIQMATLGGVTEVQAGGGTLFCQTYERAMGQLAAAGYTPLPSRRSLLLMTQAPLVWPSSDVDALHEG